MYARARARAGLALPASRLPGVGSMPLVEQLAAVVIGAVLLHASYYDLRYAHVHDLHAVAVSVAGVVVAVVNGAVPAMLETAAVYAGFAAVLWIVNVWGSGDMILMAALGTTAYPIPVRFFYNFGMVALIYLFFHRILRREKARFAPVFFVTWVLAYLGAAA